MDEITRANIKSLLLKGFGKEEIIKVIQGKIDDEEINELVKEINGLDITENSVLLYNELQKDLSKLVLKEFNTDNRDSNIILNAIRVQAELQEKKINLSKKIVGATRINKEYIYSRDKEIIELKNKGLNEKEIASKLGLSILSIKQSVDRFELGLSDNLKSVNPSIISETMGLDKQTRIKILNDVYENSLTRKEVREIVNQMKNEAR